MSATDNSDDRFRTFTKGIPTTPWRRDRYAKALREIDALVEEAAKPSPPAEGVPATGGGIPVPPYPAPDTDLDWF